MPARQRFIEQATVFDIIGKPWGYDDLPRMQKHYLRHDARIKYDRERGSGRSHKWAASIALEQANLSARFYREQQRMIRIEKRCGAKAKRTGKPCRMRPEPSKERCKFHGGMSTGPKSLEGRIKALSKLKQYKARPDLLQARVERLRAEWGKDLFDLTTRA